jgi:hypothetical protein
MCQRGLANTRHILDKKVAPGKKSDQRLFDHLPFAFDNRLNGFNQEADFFLWLNLWQSNPCGFRVFPAKPSGRAETGSGVDFFVLSNRLLRATKGSLILPWRALNSAVECHLHTVEVTGSNPVAPTIPSSFPSLTSVF